MNHRKSLRTLFNLGMRFLADEVETGDDHGTAATAILHPLPAPVSAAPAVAPAVGECRKSQSLVA